VPKNLELVPLELGHAKNESMMQQKRALPCWYELRLSVRRVYEKPTCSGVLVSHYHPPESPEGSRFEFRNLLLVHYRMYL
jgi:hypothetical protein